MPHHPGSFVLQGIVASNDEEDHISQEAAPSYSSVAPLGLPAGDPGRDSFLML